MRQLALNIGRRLQLVVWLLVLTGFAALIWLGATPAGTRYVVSEINKHFADIIHIELPTGTLFDGIQFQQLTVRTDTTSIEAANGKLDWKLAHLIERTLVLDEVRANSVTVNNTSAAVEPQTETPPPSIPTIKIPLAIELRDLQLDELHIEQNGEPQIALEDIYTDLTFQHDLLDIKNLSITHQDFLATGHGKLTLSGHQNADLQLLVNYKENSGLLKVAISGPLENYQWKINSNLKLETTPDYTLQASGTGSLSGLIIDETELETLDGALHSNGKLHWWPTLSADITLRGENLKPEQYWKDIPGRLGFKGGITLENNKLDFQLTGAGQLRSYPLSFIADGNYHHPTLKLDQVKLTSAQNVLKASGQLSAEQDSTIVYQLRAPDLTNLHPELAGQMQATGQLQGTLKAPTLQTELSGAELRWKDQTIEKLALTISPKEADLHDIDLSLTRLAQGKTLLDQLHVEGTASLEKQNLTLSAKNQEWFSLRSHINSSSDLKGKSIHGEIQHTDLTLRQRLPLKQSTASTFQWNTERQQLSPFCLKRNAQKLCLDAAFGQQNGQATFEAAEIPLSLLSSEIQSTQQSFNLRAELNKTQGDWQLKSHGDVDNKATFDADLSLSKQNKLGGNVQANIPDLRWLELLSTAISEPSGNVSADLTLDGNLSKPSVQGKILLDNASVKIPTYGTDITDIQMALDFPTLDRAKLDGKLTAGGADLNLGGTLKWDNPKDYALQLNAKGEALQVMNTHEAKVWVSPDITLKADSNSTRVSGTLTVPKAEITPAELPVQAARVSSDEEIISSAGPSQNRRKNLPVEINVGVKIGNEEKKQAVKFEGFGLSTELKGQLQISQLPEKPLLGDGNIRMIDGYYKAYGQDLAIEKGQIFFNGPLDNPGFSIEAVREAGEVKAGIRVNGTLDAPQSTLFSTPTLSDTDTLSYLLTGQPFKRDSSDADSNETNPMLLLAATRWGLKAGGGIVEDIQKTTGIDTFKLSSEDDINQSALLIGKYLTPKLYIQYAMKLFEETNLFSLNYTLTPSLSLEAESGTSQGLNLIYRLERD